MREFNYNEALQKAAQLCAGRERSPFDIKKKLLSWKISEEEADSIIVFLKNENYLSEERYAGTFTNDKIKFGKWGKSKVYQHLKMLGIADRYAQKAISDFDKSDYHSMVEIEIKKKALQIKKKTKIEARNALYRFAQSRGYEHELIEEFVNNIIS